MTEPRVLIVGAGWRISAFVLPALISLGLDPEDLRILRKRALPLEGDLARVRTVEWETLPRSFEITINCVSSHSLLSVQQRLVHALPRAIHFCDTPILERLRDLPQVRRLASRARIYSLEDWPFMPNVQPLSERLRDGGGPWTMRIEHFGVPTHFLALVRHLIRPGRGLLVGRGPNWIEASEPGGRDRFRLVRPKDYSRAKLSLWNGSVMIEDFFQTGVSDREDPASPSSDEVIARNVDGSEVRYSLGGRGIREVALGSGFLHAVLDQEHRKGSHELDKCVALVDIFRSALEGSPKAYPYVRSALDAATVRLSNRARLVWMP